MDRGLVEHFDEPTMNLCLYGCFASLGSNKGKANRAPNYLELQLQLQLAYRFNLTGILMMMYCP